MRHVRRLMRPNANMNTPETEWLILRAAAALASGAAPWRVRALLVEHGFGEETAFLAVEAARILRPTRAAVALQRTRSGVRPAMRAESRGDEQAAESADPKIAAK